MANRSYTLSANGNTKIGSVNAGNRDKLTWQALVCVNGTFGGGTVTLAVSPDNGTTLLTLKTKMENALSLTANGYANIEIAGFPNNNTVPLNVYAVLAGATSPAVTVTVFDNMG